MSKTLLQQSQLHNSKDYTLPNTLGSSLQSGAATLSDDLNAMRAMIKDVTGKSDWYTAADQDLAQIYAAVRASGANTELQGTLTVANGLTSLADLSASGIVDLSAAGVATNVYGTLGVAELATFNGGVEIAADTLDLANGSHLHLSGNADITIEALAGDGWVVRADANGKLVDGANMVFKDATGLDLFQGNFTVDPNGKVMIGGNEIKDGAGNKVISFGSVTSVADSVIVEHNLNVKGDMVVDGDFNVKGQMTTIDTVNVKVKDAVMMLANGDPAPDTSGLVLHGAAGALDLAIGQHGKNGEWIMAKVDGAGVNGTDPQMNLSGADLAALKAGGMKVGITEDAILGSFAPVGGASVNVSMTAENGLVFNVYGQSATSLADNAGEVTDFAARFSGASILEAIRQSSLAVDAEASRAVAAEGSIASDLSSEIVRAESVEASLASDISTEASRATAAEGSLATDLSSEASRAVAAEGSLATGLSSEVSRAVAAEDSLAMGLSAEVSRAQSAETVLTNDLSSEASTARSAEALLTSNLSTEVARAQSVEAVLTSDLSSEASRAVLAEGSLASDISTEASTARSAEALLTSNLSAEASTARSAEALLTSNLSTEVSRAQSAEAVLTSSVSSEASRAVAAEGSLASDISSEASRATAAEGSLASNISSEASRAVAAEGSLASDISSETSRAVAAEDSLALSLSSEASRAVAAEGSLATSLSSEVSRAGSVEAGLQAAIDAINAYVQDSFVVGTAVAAGTEVDFSAAVGALTAGTYSTIAAAKKVLDVYVNGVRLSYGADKDYTITAGGKLSMSFALESDDVIYIVNRAPAAAGAGAGGAGAGGAGAGGAGAGGGAAGG